MFKKILVPLDRSEHSRKALDVAIQVAKRFGGKITLIHVYSVPVTPPITPGLPTAESGFPTAETISELLNAARRAGSRILTDAKQRVKAEKVEVDERLEEGHPVQEIVRVSKEGKFDLIVMGARGVSYIREMLLGSVSHGVIHHVACPVLVVR